MDDDQLDFLRIEALKSASKKKSPNTSTSGHKEDEEEDDDEEKSLRELALKSCQKDGINKPESDNTINQNVNKEQNDFQISNKSAVEELHLREKALKSLLKMRVVKTETIIKKAIQNEIVSSSKTLPSENHTTNKKESPKEIPKKKLRMSTSLIPSTELRNFISDPMIFLNKRNNVREDAISEDEAFESGFAGSDDELSLCASDVEDDIPGDSTIQCNVISSCCDQEQKDVKETKSGKNIPNNSEPKVSPVKSNDYTVTEIKTQEISEPVKTNLKDDFEIVKYSSESVIQKSDNIDQECEISPSADIDDEQPGPSGYKPNQSDSDSNSSVIEVEPLKLKHPRVMNLITDSDESDSNVQKSGKQKLRKKKMTVKDKLAKQDGVMDEREDLQDLNCSVCLGPFEDRSFLKHCFFLHSFCYICIVQWSELSRLCPLCKKFYKSLIHHVTKELDYEEFIFPTEDEQKKKKQNAQRNPYSENMSDGRRFRYASTIVDHEVWQARREERRKIEAENALPREQRKISRRLRWSATKDRRKAIYRMKMFVKEVKQRGKPLTRDITPAFFQCNPAIKHRLVPWLLRDLNVLLGQDDEMIRFVMSLVLNLIPKIPMEGSEFKDQLRGFLFEQTDHFVDELVSFAKSPYDIRGYDSHVVYDVPPQVIEIDNDKTEPIERRILNEIFIADNDNESPLINNNNLNETDGNEEEEEKKDQNEEELSISRPVDSRTESSMVEVDCNIESTPKQQINEDSEGKKSKKKKKKRKKERKRLLNENENDLGEDGTKQKHKKKRKNEGKEREASLEEIGIENARSKVLDESNYGKENNRPKHKKKQNYRYKDGNDTDDELAESPNFDQNVDTAKDDINRKKRQKNKRRYGEFEKTQNDSESSSNQKAECNIARKRKKKKRQSNHKERDEEFVDTGTNLHTSAAEGNSQDLVANDSDSDQGQMHQTADSKEKEKELQSNEEIQNLENLDESQETSAKNEEKRKKKKKKRKKKHHNGGEDVTELLSKFLDSNKQHSEYDRGINQIESYLGKDNTRRKNKAIIKELLSIEKSLLRNQRKKEVQKLLDKQRVLEETRSMKRRAGDPDYFTNDEVIYKIDDQLESLYRKIDKK